MIITKQITLNEIKEEVKDILDSYYYNELRDYIIDDFDRLDVFLEPYYCENDSNPFINSNIDSKHHIYELFKEHWPNHGILEALYDIVYCILEQDLDVLLDNIERVNEDDFEDGIERLFEYEEVEEDTGNLILLDQLHFLRLVEEYFNVDIPHLEELEDMVEKGLIL